MEGANIVTAGQSRIVRAITWPMRRFADREILRVVVYSTLLLLIVFGIAFYASYSSLVNNERKANTTANNVVRLLDHDISSIIRNNDTALKSVAYEVERQLSVGRIDAASINSYSDRILADNPEVLAVRIVDAEGTIHYGSDRMGNEHAAVWVGDRGYFLQSRDEVTAGLHFSPPIVARTVGRSVIIMARRVAYPNGKFAGIVSELIELSFFEKMFHSVDLGPHGAVILRTSDMNLVAASFPENEAPPVLGSNSVSSTLREMLTTSPEGGTYTAQSGTDHLARVFAYRKIHAYPGYIIVGVAQSDIRAEWWKEMSILLVLALLFITALTVGVVLIARNILNRNSAMLALHRSEAEIRNLNFDLERRVKERTARLTEANQELEQFAYVASHDLRQPLRAVASYLNLIEARIGGDLSDELKGFFKFAVDGARRMDRLIVDLLEFSRTGRSQNAIEVIATTDAVSLSLVHLKVAIDDAEAEIRVAADLPTVTGVRVDLVRLFQNLIGNALKYRARNRRCEIGVGVDDCGTEWRFWVRDNGIGIPADQRDRVFLIFQRLHKSSEYEGTGIGLAICKKIVANLGGQIWVESVHGDGSTFFFTVPKVMAPLALEA